MVNSSSVKSCNDFFGTRDFYAALKIDKNASTSQVKRAYYHLSLQCHPDRVEGREEKSHATKKFQTLSKIYSTLSDEEKRKVYDETGVVLDDDDEECMSKSDGDWLAYWRLLFPKVTADEIRNFEVKYRGSADEEADVIQAYVEGDGNVMKIVDSVPCSTLTDHERFYDIIQKKIDSGELEKKKKFKKVTKQVLAKREREANEEAVEAATLVEELKASSTTSDVGSDEGLRALIKERNKSREQGMDAFYDSLLTKYGKTEGRAKKRGKK